MPDVKCRTSKDHRCHETTELYDPSLTTTGKMLRLKKQYKSYCWQELGATLSRDALQCPICGTPYPNGQGRVALHEEEETRLEGDECVLVPGPPSDQAVHDSILADPPVKPTRTRQTKEVPRITPAEREVLKATLKAEKKDFKKIVKVASKPIIVRKLQKPAEAPENG